MEMKAKTGKSSISANLIGSRCVVKVWSSHWLYFDSPLFEVLYVSVSSDQSALAESYCNATFHAVQQPCCCPWCWAPVRAAHPRLTLTHKTQQKSNSKKSLTGRVRQHRIQIRGEGSSLSLEEVEENSNVCVYNFIFRTIYVPYWFFLFM